MQGLTWGADKDFQVKMFCCFLIYSCILLVKRSFTISSTTMSLYSIFIFFPGDTQWRFITTFRNQIRRGIVEQQSAVGLLSEAQRLDLYLNCEIYATNQELVNILYVLQLNTFWGQNGLLRWTINNCTIIHNRYAFNHCFSNVTFSLCTVDEGPCGQKRLVTANDCFLLCLSLKVHQAYFAYTYIHTLSFIHSELPSLIWLLQVLHQHKRH